MNTYPSKQYFLTHFWESAFWHFGGVCIDCQANWLNGKLDHTTAHVGCPHPLSFTKVGQGHRSGKGYIDPSTGLDLPSFSPCFFSRQRKTSINERLGWGHWSYYKTDYAALLKALKWTVNRISSPLSIFSQLHESNILKEPQKLILCPIWDPEEWIAFVHMLVVRKIALCFYAFRSR